MEIEVKVASEEHLVFAEAVCELLESSAKAKGTGIAKRSIPYIYKKIEEGKAIIALHKNQLAGFCYIETWAHGKYVANSGLVVHPDYRHHGLARTIKKQAFLLSRKKYPEAILFGITTSQAVMKINTELGYEPVTFSELPQDEEFWKGCSSCPNHDILMRTEHKYCLCTGMRLDPSKKKKSKQSKAKAIQNGGS